MFELVWPFLANIAETLLIVLPSAIGFAVAFAVLSLFTSQACNPGRTWWRNPGLATDICYILIIPFLAPYLRMSLMIGGAALLSGVMTTEEIADYFEHGRGPFAVLPFWVQLPVYVVASDFLLYWNHRLFHGASLWRFHAVHHSAEEVDWTTAYRFHPVNLWLGSFLVSAVMLFLGLSPTVLLFLVAFDTTTAAFVHANLNWTLGPLKYVVATPVFHRWHHTLPDEGGNSNFAPTFAFWDWIFGTFYMPEGKLPQTFGCDDHLFPEGYFQQLLYPFRDLIETSVPGRVKPQPP